MPDDDPTDHDLDTDGEQSPTEDDVEDELFGGPGVEEVLERPGWLTTSERELLLGESDWEPGTDHRRQARRRMRQRLIGGFLDMILVERHLDPRDRELVLDRFDAKELLSGDFSTDVNGADHLRAFGYLFAFLWRGLKGHQPTFRDHLEDGIIRGEHDPAPGIDLVDRYNVTLTVEEQMPRDTPINYADLAALLAEGPHRGRKISRDTLDQLLAAIEKHDPGPAELGAAIDVLAGEAEVAEDRSPGSTES